MSAEKISNTDFRRRRQDRISTRSLTKSFGLHAEQPDVELAHGMKLQDFSLINEMLLKSSICRECRNPKSKLRVYQCNVERSGLAETLFVLCSHCSNKTPFYSSKRLPGKKGSFEINRRSTLAATSRAELARFCAKLDLPPPVTKRSYNVHMEKIVEKAIIHAEQKMMEAGARLHALVEKDDPESMHVNEEGVPIANIAVSVDGTWQKRGHTSKIGVVFVLSVLTGEVLDYEVLSHVCHACVAQNNLDKESEEYKAWRTAHDLECQINHVGSSGDMEAKGAIAIFSRSIQKHKLRYSKFVGDGDSSCFGCVAEAMAGKYGVAYEVTKEECVGHVQKRMGAALMEYKKSRKGKKLADGKNVGGQGRLTDESIKKIQNYYGFAIRQNSGNLEGMKKAILAIQHHLIRSDDAPLDEQHKHCPRGTGTWCKYWQDKTNSSRMYDDSKRLPAVFLQELQPIFQRLSQDTLLSRCLLGLTQNQNESLNGQLWSRVPKTMFCGKRKVIIAACETICVANTGAASKAFLLEDMGIAAGQNMVRALHKEDNERIKHAARKISARYRKKRKQLKYSTKSKVKNISYRTGSYGTSSKPDSTKTSREIKQAAQSHNKDNEFTDIPITFIDENQIVGIFANISG